MMPSRLVALAALVLLSLVLLSCEREASAPAGAQALQKTAIQLNWKPEPQFGGFYAAQQTGAYARHGLEVEVVPGGVGTPTVQMVGAGQVDFAVVSADELILARSQGNNVVALFAVYQTCPQGLMTHEERGLNDIGDVFANPGTVAMQRGLPYAQFLENKYGFDKVRIVPSPGGDLSAFRSDPTFTQQCFVTSEPIAARRLGLRPQTFLIADAGYNPYTTVVVTRDEVLRDRRPLVEAVVRAVAEGWRAYLDDPAATNAMMRELNPTMDEETFVASADVQKDLIETDETRANGLGSMTAERWETLGRQLVSLGVVRQAPPAGECFVDPVDAPAGQTAGGD